MEESQTELRSLIGKIFTWKDEHMRDSSDMRLQFSKQISEIMATIQVNQSQYNEIIRRLGEHTESFNKINEKIERIKRREE